MNHRLVLLLRSSSTSSVSSLLLLMIWIPLIITTIYTGKFSPRKQLVVVVNGFQRNIAWQPRHHYQQQQQQKQHINNPLHVLADPSKKTLSYTEIETETMTSTTQPSTTTDSILQPSSSTTTTPLTNGLQLSTTLDDSSSSSGGSSSSSNDTVNGATITTTTTTNKLSESSTPSPRPRVLFGGVVPIPHCLIVLWKFTRPHTLIGSALAIPSIHALAAPSLSALWTTTTLYSIVYATIPALLMNLYITGLNQITDVEIDKINKPNLPIAAGLLKQRDAIVICMVALVTSLYMGTVGHARYSTQGLQVALWGSGILGTLYSVEPFRLKRYPVLAALCIVAVRGTIINASFFAHAMAAVFQQPSATVLSCLMNDPRCLFSSIFFGIFGIVIALMKDVPDVLGDKYSNIRTFSVRVGPTRIFHSSRKMLMGLFYVCTAGFVQRAIATSISTSPSLAVCRYVVALACFTAARSIRQQSKVVDPTNPTQVYNYYMHLWKIFYMSYMMLPLAR